MILAGDAFSGRMSGVGSALASVYRGHLRLLPSPASGVTAVVMSAALLRKSPIIMLPAAKPPTTEQAVGILAAGQQELVVKGGARVGARADAVALSC